VPLTATATRSDTSTVSAAVREPTTELVETRPPSATPTRHDGAVGLYLARIHRVPLLSAEEELGLFTRLHALRRWQNRLREGLERSGVMCSGDAPVLTCDDARLRLRVRRLRAVGAAAEAVRNRIVEANLRLAVAMAKRYQNRGVCLPDLVQEANLGLIRAVERFDHRKGVRFGTYAAWWIQQALGLAVANTGRTVRVPAYLQEWQRRLHNARERSAGTEDVPLAALARSAGISERQARRALVTDRETLYLDAPTSADTRRTLSATLPDATTPRPDEEAERAELSQAVESALAHVDERTARVLRLRYGFDDGVPRSLQEVGDILHLSRERIRQVESEAFQRLRSPVRARQLRALWHSA
jgi:RNA polymerase primary sigma factor